MIDLLIFAVASWAILNLIVLAAFGAWREHERRKPFPTVREYARYLDGVPQATPYVLTTTRDVSDDPVLLRQRLVQQHLLARRRDLEDAPVVGARMYVEPYVSDDEWGVEPYVSDDEYDDPRVTPDLSRNAPTVGEK